MSTDDDEYRAYFGQRLKTARKKIGLNQAELAARIGVARDTYGRYERGELSPTAETLARIAVQLHEVVDADWLLFGHVTDLQIPEAIKLKRIGYVSGLAFGEHGGSARVSFGIGDVLRIVEACLQLGEPDDDMRAAITHAIETIVGWLSYPDLRGMELDVPIARHAVQFQPILPTDESAADVSLDSED